MLAFLACSPIHSKETNMSEYTEDLSLTDLSAISWTWNSNVDSKVTDAPNLPSMDVVTTESAQKESETSERESDDAIALLLPNQWKETNQVASSTATGRSENERPKPMKRSKLGGSDRWPRAKKRKNDQIVEQLAVPAVPVVLPTNCHDADTIACIQLLDLLILKSRQRKRRIQQQIDDLDEEMELALQLMEEYERTGRRERRLSSNETPRVVTPDDTRGKSKKLRISHFSEPNGMELLRLALPDELVNDIEPQGQKHRAFEQAETLAGWKVKGLDLKGSGNTDDDSMCDDELVNANKPQDQKRCATEPVLQEPTEESKKEILSSLDTDDDSSSDDSI